MERVEELIMRWEEDELSEAEVEELVELLQDSNNRWKFHEHMQTSQTMAAFFQAEGGVKSEQPKVATRVKGNSSKQKTKTKRRMRTSSVHNVAYRTRQMKAVRPRSSKGILYMASAAAAAAILVVIGLVSMKLFTSESSAISAGAVASSEGSVTILRSGRKLSSGPGVTVMVGDSVAVNSGRATVKLNDGTLVTASRHTRFRISAGGKGAARLHVERGRIDLDVRKQYQGQQFVVTGPHSRATVLGTQFSFAVSQRSTRLDVDEGRVRYERFSGGIVVGTLILTANQYAIAGEGIKFEILSKSGPAKADPEDGGTKPDPNPKRIAVTGFTLINADTDQAIRPLRDGDQVSLSRDGQNLSIRADTTRLVSSVAFSLNGVRQTVGKGAGGIEDFEPFSLTGDTDGDYNVWSPKAGTYTVRAIPYAGLGGKGGAGTAKQITIKVIR